MQRPRQSLDSYDPLAIFTRPPANETPEARSIRLQQEAEAQRVSDAIDESLRAERAAMRRQRSAIKMLLLGQSESGKSTTLKNIQLQFAPNSWASERASWRAVIQLNLVRSVNTILDALASEMSAPSRSSYSHPPTPGSRSRLSSSFEREERRERSPPPTIASFSRSSVPPIPFTNHHSLLKLRLAPLRSVEADLKSFLGDIACEEASGALTPESDMMMATPFDSTSYGPGSISLRRPREFTVRSHTSWKVAIGQHCRLRSTSPHGRRAALSECDGLTEVIAGCQEDMKALWNDGAVKELIRRRRVKLEDSTPYFFENVDRIARRNYDPSDSDVLRARLRTLGVQEHRITFENSMDYGREWIIYDVGGSRTSRSAWLPYFDDAHAVLFLAPISCFDEHLNEDPKINRLQDSFVLWKSIVSSRLLTRTTIILFMNKYDLLQKKLESGVKVNRFLTSYADRENKASTVAKYLRSKFKDTFRESSPQPRPFYAFITSVIDKTTTAITLASGPSRVSLIACCSH
ncbi:hypothetical protein NLI96_g11307 [Meripilus lineatus]|uniref:G-alpha-domain-containing protein n=1 Tax=Meripilus lineatus TaxID=2056292 RepID=A0AAD5Y8J2_9APHY|nr:hypothetical protein NLI96_g11307 [Physisporinus lineatus]